jgi:hypothetical protein
MRIIAAVNVGDSLQQAFNSSERQAERAKQKVQEKAQRKRPRPPHPIPRRAPQPPLTARETATANGDAPSSLPKKGDGRRPPSSRGPPCEAPLRAPDVSPPRRRAHPSWRDRSTAVDREQEASNGADAAEAL